MQATPSVHYLKVQPSKSWASLRLGELWASRELLYFFTLRDIKVRYKQTFLGATWAIIQPVFSMVVFSLFFGRLGKMPSDGIPYPIFSLAALVPWMFFATSLQQASTSVVSNSALLKKVYFPRLAIPMAPVLAAMVDFAISFTVLLVFMMVGFRIMPTARALYIIPFLVLALITSLAVSLWLAALNVVYRDVQYVIPFLIQFWLFATPIAYPSSLLPGALRTIYGLNPMAGVVEGFRWALLGSKTAPGPMLAVSIVAAIALLVGGLLYFRHMETSFADLA